MTERRNSDRIAVAKLQVREMNGDYIFSFRALNLSEEGLFLENKLLSDQEPFSKLSFTLPNSKHLKNLTAKIVREERKGNRVGCAYEFMNLSEDARMELKKYFYEHLLRGTA
jgi:hypothetical protein